MIDRADSKSDESNPPLGGAQGRPVDAAQGKRPLGTLPPRPRRRRRWRKVLLCLLLLLVLALLAVKPYLSQIVAGRLRNAVEARLHAELHFDSITYDFPYGVHFKNVRFTTDEEQGRQELISVDRLQLQLAQLPLPKSPVVIKSISLENPAVRIIRTSEGIVGTKGMRRSDGEMQLRPPKEKLSEMFELQGFTITGGKLVYEDRTRRGAVPMVFHNIAIDLGITQKSKAVYAFQFKTQQQKLLQLDVAGTMDIDALVLELEKVSMLARADRNDGESSLPPSIQKIITSLQIGGSIGIDGSAKLPLRDMSNATASADLKLTDARAVLPAKQGMIEDLDAAAHCEVRGATSEIRLTQFVACAGTAGLTLNEAVTKVDHRKWRINGVTGTLAAKPGDVMPNPTTGAAATQPATIAGTQLLGGSIEMAADVYGEIDTPTRYSIMLRPRDLKVRPDGFFGPIEEIFGEMRIGNDSIEFWNMSAKLLDGNMQARGTINLLASPVTYQMGLEASELDMKQLVTMPLLRGKMPALSGLGEIKSDFSGEFPTGDAPIEDRLSASGRVWIRDGELYEVKWLTRIADALNINPATLTLGEAAALVSINKRVVTFKRAVINSPVLGVQGKGTLTFDKQMDFDLIAAPLGNWREHVNSLNIPLVGNVAGNIAGQMQRVVSATSKLLYAFRVQGKLPDPTVKPVPAPMLTDTAALVFSKMVDGVNEDHELVKSVEEQK